MTDACPPVRETGAVFERVLDEALDCRRVRDALDRAGGALSREQLRSRARQAQPAITAAAAAEYQEYLRSTCAEEASGDAPPPAVRASLLFAGAAALLLPAGYGLSAFAGHPYIGGGLVTAGLMAGSLAVGAGAGDLLWQRLTRTTARPDDAAPPDPDTPRATPPAGAPGAAEEAARAREAWERALRERGVVPFLLGRLEEAAMGRRL
ncbi:hypothetical protein [Streptomyces griseosporeus]|uniref:hypothetical protein n=1 Tax=Streptomyces griseosporeus TaxID=1910 RepID=UPI0036B95F57